MSLPQTPSQTVGPYFAYGLVAEQYNYPFSSVFDGNLAGPETPGQHILIQGNVFDGDGNAVADALIEISQADAAGQRPASLEQVKNTGFRGFGRSGTGTDPQLRFTFHSVKPAAVGGEAPHIDVIVMMRGMLLHTFTRIYFEDEMAANARDPVLAQVPQDRRHTLIAKRQSLPGGVAYRFDIHMQGPEETVFFDL